MTNVILHALNALLLFLILKHATGSLWRSFMVAALFALHPINVEAVVWIAERKTMLSTLFFLLALAAYTRFAQRPTLSRYSPVFGLFALGLMSKPQVIMLPVILLLWGYWPLERMFPVGSESPESESFLSPWSDKLILRLLLEKVPLFALSAASAAITIYAQRMARTDSWGYSTTIRLANAVVAYVRYIGKALWPSALAPEYPHPGASLPHWQVWGASAILLAISALVLVARRHRYLLVGWFWFLITLLPMVGLVQVGKQAMADRYAYISFIGLYIISCWGVTDLIALVARSRRFQGRRHIDGGPAALDEVRSISFALLSALCLASLFALSALTYRQVGYWRDNLTLWYHAVAVVKHDWIADDEIGLSLERMGRPEQEVLPYFYKASEIAYSDRLSDSQIALYDQAHGKSREAIDRFQRMLLNPYPLRVAAEVYQDIGVEYQELGDRVHAEAAFNKAQTCDS